MINELKHRPLALFCAFFVISTYLSERFSLSLSLSCAAILFCISVLFFAYDRLSAFRGRKDLISLIPLTVGLCAGLIFGSLYNYSNRTNVASLNGKDATIVGVIDEVSYKSDYLSSFTVTVTSVNGEKNSFKAHVDFPYEFDAEENDIISARVLLYKPTANSYFFDSESYYESNGVYLCADAYDSGAEIIGRDDSIKAFFKDLSYKTSLKFKVALGNENGGFISGLLLGRRSDIPDSLSTSFRYLGISHILSVSGLHLSLLVAAIAYFLKKLHTHLKIRLPLIIAFIIAFSLLTGSRPPVIRAAIMITLMLISKIGPRRYDAPTAFSFAAFVIVAFSPSVLHNASFALSFSATAGIVFLGTPICNTLRKIVKDESKIKRLGVTLLTPIIISITATLFTLPAIALFFGEVSLFGVISNLIFVPICTLLLYLSIVLLIFYNTPLITAISTVIGTICNFNSSFSYTLSQILPEPISLRYGFSMIVIIVTFIVLSLLILLKKQKLTSLLIACSFLIITYSGCSMIYSATSGRKDSLTFINSGSNDYVIINSNEKTLLCDISSGAYSPCNGAASITSDIVYDCSFDALLITHIHRKHINTIARLADNYRFNTLYIPSPKNADEVNYVAAITASAKSKGIRIIQYNTEIKTLITFENVNITLYPHAYLKRSTQPVDLIKFKSDKTVIYAGSAVYESELRIMLEKELTQSNFLLLGSHGPKIKERIPSLSPHLTVYSANTLVNDEYGCSYEVIYGYKKIKI